MSTSIEAEIEAYQTIQRQVEGKVIWTAGLAIFCAPGVMSPTNRVTQCFGSALRTICASSVLDLGCGTGILALIASQNAHEVVGIDIDPCAVACAQYNARLNGIKNVEFLLGDGYGSVAQRRFDLIVSNPPFYPGQAPASMCIKDDKALIYSLIEGIRQHLNPHGQGYFVTSSLSNNNRVRELLQALELPFNRQLLHQGRGNSQDIYLWQVTVEP
jgi:methylase of polypeptide subunit release factors